MTDPMEPASRSTSKYLYLGLLLLVIIFFALVRWHLRNIPLERDEGEYAYAGQLMLHGIPPYTLLYSMKLPGSFAGYAAIMAIFGQTIAGIHLGVLVINAATTFLIFLLGKRLFGPLAGVVAAASYALLSTSPSVIGLAGHATHFVVLPAVGGVLLLLSAVERRGAWRCFWSGVLFGLAFLMKQPGIMFGIFGGVYLLKVEWGVAPRDWRSSLRRVVTYAGGVVLPFLVTCLAMVACGAFTRFWFWTFLYAREYATTIPLGDGFDLLRLNFPQVVQPAIWIWIFAAVGLSAIAWDRAARERRFVLITFLVFSALAVCPGLYFRKHYFILLLPAVALLAGAAVSRATEALDHSKEGRAWSFLPAAIFVVAFISSIYAQRVYLFEMDPITASRAVYGLNPFPEAVKVADYIKSHSPPDARIAVLGSEPEIYFYADRRSATGYIYTYSLMEPQPYAVEMQKAMIGEIEAARPEYVVLVNVPESFGRLRDSDPHIFSWMDRYVPEEYEAVGVADMFDGTTYVWADEGKAYQPRSRSFIRVYKRKGS